MKNTIGSQNKNIALYLLLGLLLLTCLWIGWHDFDPRIPQEMVRENIRAGIRGIVQLAVQYFIPINILVFFAQEIVTNMRAKQLQQETQ